MKKTITTTIILAAAVLTLGGCLTLLFGDYDYDYSSYDNEQASTKPAQAQEAPVKPAQPATVQKPPKEETAPAVEAASIQQEQAPETQPPQPAAAQPQVTEPQPEPVAEIKPVTPEPVPLPKETTHETVPAADTVPESEWVLLDNPISSTAELFSYVRGPWLNEFEPDREYNMVFEIRRPEALHWGITMYLRNPYTGNFEPIEFSGTGNYRYQTLSTAGFDVGDLVEYYFEFYIPEHDQRYIYGKYPDYYLGFDIKEDAFEFTYEIEQFKWTKELVEQHIKVLPIKNTPYGDYADVVVIADEEAADWKLTARAKVLHELKYRDWTVQIDTELNYSNGRFSGRIPLDPDKPLYYEYNQNILWRGDVLNYYIDVDIADTKDAKGGSFRIETDNPHFTVLNDIKAKYTKADVENFLYYTPYASPFPYSAKKYDFKYLLSSPANKAEKWYFNIYMRAKGSNNDFKAMFSTGQEVRMYIDIEDIEDPFGQNHFAAIYEVNNWEYNAEHLSIGNIGKPGDTVEYYFSLECTATDQIFEFHRDDLLEAYIPLPKTDIVDNYSLQNQPFAALTDRNFRLSVYVGETPDISGLDNMVCTLWYRGSTETRWTSLKGRKNGVNQILLDIPYKDYFAGTTIEYWVDLDRGDQRARIGSADAPLRFEVVEEYPREWEEPPYTKPVEY